MIKTILYNLIRKFKLFLTNKTNNEFLSKLYVEEIHKKLRVKQVNQYALNGFRVYSQNEEDGIIENIFDDIGTTNKIFCEIGIGDCIENNTHYLLLKDWKGIWIDIRSKYINKLKGKITSDQRLLDLLIYKVDKENINKIIGNSNIIIKIHFQKSRVCPGRFDRSKRGSVILYGVLFLIYFRNGKFFFIAI